MDWLFHYADPTIDWNYAMVTLVVRFIGVFIVMGVIQVALQVSARVIGAAEKRGETSAALLATAGTASTAAVVSPDAALDEATVAAIGAALALESRAGAIPAMPGATSAWGVAGRIQQLRR